MAGGTIVVFFDDVDSSNAGCNHPLAELINKRFNYCTVHFLVPLHLMIMMRLYLR
jgi:hypothetical protein